jgi:hypothetical protein
MSDCVERPGDGQVCKERANMLAKHDVKLNTIEGRLDTFERLLREVREKLFNGYDTKISHTNEKVTEIAATVKELANKGGIDMAEVEVLINKKIKDQEREETIQQHWVKKHRIEILALFVAACTLGMVILTFVSG